MQRCFIEETPLASPDGRALLDTINGLIHTCREAGVLVAHTRGWMAKDRSNLGVMAELVPPFVVELYTEGSPTAELHEALDVAPEDLIINKARYGAFHGTDLARQLRERGIESVIISGIATNICCETTACEASQHDFRVVFLSDGTATREMNGVPAEELQRATLASLGMVFTQIATVEEVTEQISDIRPRRPRQQPLTAGSSPNQTAAHESAGSSGSASAGLRHDKHQPAHRRVAACQAACSARQGVPWASRGREAKGHELRAVSLFGGCGGMDLGFRRAGFQILRSIDNNPAAAAVHVHNLGPTAYLGDVTDVDFGQWRDEFGSVDVVLGGFPCQGFSKAGPKRADDPRNSLYRAMRDAVQFLEPAYFVAENVEGLAQNFGGQYLELIQDDFRQAGYEVSVNLLDAIGYGVPQHRRRIFLVGRRINSPAAAYRWPDPEYAVVVRNGETGRPRAMPSWLHGIKQDGPFALNDPLTISHAISDLRELSEQVADHQIDKNWPGYYDHVIKSIGQGQKLCNVRHGPESVRTWDIPEAFGPVSAAERTILEVIARNRRHKQYGSIPNGNPLPVAVIERLSGLHDLGPVLDDLCRRGFAKKKNNGYDLLGALFCSGLFKRPTWNAPSPTVLTDFGNPRYFLHPLEDRPFSLREAARLQGFPDDFEFTSAGVSLPDGYRLVGNAVPPALAEALAVAVRTSMTSRGREAHGQVG